MELEKEFELYIKVGRSLVLFNDLILRLCCFKNIKKGINNIGERKFLSVKDFFDNRNKKEFVKLIENLIPDFLKETETDPVKLYEKRNSIVHSITREFFYGFMDEKQKKNKESLLIKINLNDGNEMEVEHINIAFLDSFNSTCDILISHIIRKTDEFLNQK